MQPFTPDQQGPVLEDPGEASARLGLDEYDKLLELPRNRPHEWVRIRWYESDRGAERSVLKLKKRYSADEWEFTSRRIPAKDGGGSKLFAKCLVTRPVGTSAAVPAAVPTVADNEITPDPTDKTEVAP